MPAVDGIVSGLDTSALIAGIIGVAAVPKIMMELQVEDLEDTKTKIATMKNLLTTLSTLIKTMDEDGEFQANTANSSDDDQFTATVSSSAIPGTYSVQVTALAAAEVEMLNHSFDSKDTLGDMDEGTLTITYAGTETEVLITSADTSAETFAAKISSAISGVNAYVLTKNPTATYPYRVMIQGEQGSNSAGNLNDLAFSFTETVDNQSWDLGSWLNQQTASNATATIAGTSVTMTSNVATNILPGVTLNLLKVGASAATLTVNRDNATMKTNVQSFLDAYNEVITHVKIQSVYNAEAGIKGALMGENSAKRVVDRMGTTISSEYPTGVQFTALSMAGIETTKDGTLSLDGTDFDSALNDNYDALITLFTHASGPLATLRDQIDDTFVDTTNGTLSNREDSIDSQIEDMQESIARFNKRLKSMEDRLRDQFTKMEIILGNVQNQQNYLSQLFNQGSYNNN